MSKQKSGCAWWSVTITLKGNSGDPQVVINYFEDQCKNYWFQLERGENGEKKLHYQCCFQYSDETKKRQTAMIKWIGILCEKIDAYPPNKHSVTPVGDNRTNAIQRYVSKCDTRQAGPWCSQEIYNVYEDMKEMQKPYPWQQHVLDCVKVKPNNRHIYWIYDPKGNHGKSSLCKWMFLTKQAKLISVNNADRLTSAIVSAGPFKCYLLDIPRSLDAKKSIGAAFEIVESLKNGLILDNFFGKDKYLAMKSPWVFVFSNRLPDMCAVSEDRWQVIHVNNYEWIPLAKHEVQGMLSSKKRKLKGD